MKKLLLTALLCFCVNAYAVNWKLITKKSNGVSLYADVDNIKKHNGLVYFWFLADDLVSFKIGGDNAYSLILKYKANCGEGKLTQMSATAYSQAMGKGRIVFESTDNPIRYPTPNTPAYSAMELVCDNAK